MSNNARALYLNNGVQKQLQDVDVLQTNSLATFGTVPSNVLNLFSGADSTTTTVNFLTGLSNAAAVLNIGTGLVGASNTINIGGPNSKVDIGGDLEVSGDEVVVGDTTFQTDVTFGDGLGAPTNITFSSDAKVVSNLIFDTTPSAKSITGNGTNALILTNASADVTVSTTASGTLLLSSAGAANITAAANSIWNIIDGTLSINGYNGATYRAGNNANCTLMTTGTGTVAVTSGSGGIDITGNGPVDITTATTAHDINIAPFSGGAIVMSVTGAGVLDLNAAGGGIDIDSDAFVTINAAGNSHFTTTGASSMTIQSGTGGLELRAASSGVDIVAAGASTFAVASSTLTLSTTGLYNISVNPGSGQLAVSTAHVNTAISMTVDNSGTPRDADILVGSGSPHASVTGSTGDIYLEVGTGAPYYCTGTTNWTQVGSATGFSSLQQAYDTGNTITTAGTTPIYFTLTSGGFNVTTSAAGDIQFDNGTSNYLFIDGSTGATTLSALAAQLTLSTISSGEIDVTSAGAVDINAATGVTVDGTAISIDGTAASNLSVTGANLTLSTLANTGVAGGDVVIDAVRDVTGGSIMMTADHPSSWTVAGTSATPSLSLTTSTGHIVLNSAEAVGVYTTGTNPIHMAPGESRVQIETTGATRVLSLDSGSAANNISFELSDGAPGAVTANNGSLYMDSNAGGLYMRIGGSWVEVAGAGADTLQEAYNASAAPALIEMVADKNLAFETFYHATTPSNFLVQHEGGGNNFIATTTTSALAGTVQLGSTNVTLEALNTLEFTGSSRIVQSTNNNMTVRTVTAGILAVTSAGILDLDGTNVTVDATEGISLDAGAASNFTTTFGALSLTGAGGVTVTSTGGTLLLNGTGQTVDINSAALDIDASGAVTVNGDTTMTFTAVNGMTSFVCNNQEFDVNASIVDLNATNGITLDAGAASNFTTSSGAITVQGVGLVLEAGIGGFNIQGDTGSTVNVAGGSLTLSTTTSGTLSVTSAGILDLSSSGANLNITAGVNYDVNITASGTGDVDIAVSDNADADITFVAHGSGVIPFNSVSPNADLVGFTATSIIGALNELKADAGSGLVSTYVIANVVTIVAGDAVYIDTDGKVALTDSDAAATAKFLGIAKTGGTGDVGGTVEADVYIGGEVTSTAIGGTPNEGDYVYLSGTAGDLTVDAPTSGILLRVGVITDATTNQLVIQVGTPVEL